MKAFTEQFRQGVSQRDAFRGCKGADHFIKIVGKIYDGRIMMMIASPFWASHGKAGDDKLTGPSSGTVPRGE
jgi:hypothetical protein